MVFFEWLEKVDAILRQEDGGLHALYILCLKLEEYRGGIFMGCLGF